MKTLGADLYARVSTAEQQRLPMQISAMREYAERRSWTVVASIEDVASNAKDRPKRQELIKLAKLRQFDVTADAFENVADDVFRDRLGRREKQVINDSVRAVNH